MLETTQIKQRLPFIDLIRGITIIEMISYHFLWDLVYLYNADIPWYKSHGAYIWQQSICWTFILLAGFSWHLGKKHMKRGLWAFGGGVVVSLVTAIVLPNDRVRYGVLTLIGSCILIWGLKQRRVYELDEDGNRIRDADGKFVFNAVPTTDWGSPETLEHWREAWAELL